MLAPLEIISKYYPSSESSTVLKQILFLHSYQVTTRALEICKKHPELQADTKLIYYGSMLHDIGIFRTNAPGIHCYGKFPYILHGQIGAQLIRDYATALEQDGKILQSLFMTKVARICERHTGTGMTRNDFLSLGLTPPNYDLIPETIEEKIICYVDKFYSKSHLTKEKNIAQTVASLKKYGEKPVTTFKTWVNLFE